MKDQHYVDLATMNNMWHNDTGYFEDSDLLAQMPKFTERYGALPVTDVDRDYSSQNFIFNWMFWMMVLIAALIFLNGNIMHI